MADLLWEPRLSGSKARMLRPAAYRIERCWGTLFLKAAQHKVAGGLYRSGRAGLGGKGLSAIGVGSSEHLSLSAALIRPWTGLP